ncbi:MAG: hypothetical protein GX802_00965 [Clostridiales bacterium]|nr:hypothetical protein [Clostridiales bacterium]
MKKFKRLVAIISLVMLTATVFMPLANAAEYPSIAHFTSNAYIENNFLVVDVNLNENEESILTSQIQVGYDDTLLAFDHYEQGDFDLGISQVADENGKATVSQSTTEPIDKDGLFLKFYFTFSETGIYGKTVDFNLRVMHITVESDVVVAATAEGCSFIFKVGDGIIAHFTSSAYIENDMLVAELSIEQILGDFKSCKILLYYDNLLLAFDHYEQSTVFEGRSALFCDQMYGTIEVSQAMTNDSVPVSKCGSFLKFYFNYDESTAIGSFVNFDFSITEITNSLGSKAHAKVDDTSYTFEANYGENTAFSSEAYVEGDFVVVQISLDQLSNADIYLITHCVVTLNYDAELLTFDHYEEMGAFMGNSSYEEGTDGSLSVIQQREELTQNLTGRFLKFYFKYNKEEIIGETLEFGLTAYEVVSAINVFAETSGCELVINDMGDLNGDKLVNTGDAVCLLRYVTGGEMLSDAQLLVADVNRDGTINTGDATNILMILVE